MAAGQGYVPSFGELVTTPVNPELGTGGPGLMVGRNEGIQDLMQAATFQAQMNWAKHKEIEDRKAKFFDTLKDLSQLPTMAEDRGMLRDKMSGIFKKMMDPNVFNGRDAAATADFQNDVLSYGELAGRSKQDLVNYEFNKKVMAEHPELYQNNHNVRSQEAYKTGKLGERSYDALVPTPKMDYDVMAQAATAGAITDTPAGIEVGRMVTNPVTGKQEWKADPNGDRERHTTGGKTVDEEKFKKQYTDLLSNDIASPMVRADLQFKFEEMTPEQQKQLSVDQDGKTPDFTQMIKGIVESKKPQGVAGTTTFEDNKIVAEAKKEAAALQRQREGDAAAMARTIKAGELQNTGEMNKLQAKGDTKGAYNLMGQEYANKIDGLISGSTINYNGHKTQGISLSGLSDYDKRVLGIEKDFQGKVISKYEDLMKNDKNDIVLVKGEKGGIAIVEVDDDGKPVQRLESLNKDGIRQSVIDYTISRSTGEEAFIGLAPTGGAQPPAPGTNPPGTTTGGGADTPLPVFKK